MRYIIRVSYDGKNYSGFQIQPDSDSIQARLEYAIGSALKSDIKIIASGRTDAGVSAIEQVCHIDLDTDIDVCKKSGHINSLLPRDIRVLDISIADNDFHARYSAKRKTYEYYFYTGSEIPLYENFATNIGFNIDIEKMKECCKCFLGEHDFSAFCASNTEVKDKTRSIFDINIVDISDNLYKLTITGNGFLYNMVRIIMGTLVDVGLGKINSNDISSIIESLDRSKAGKTISPKGLVLKNVEY